MLLDLASTPLSVRYQVAWSMSSLKSRSPRWSRLGTVTWVPGWPPLLQDGGHGHDLAGGAGFVHVLHGRVSQRRRVGLREVVGVEARGVGHGEDLAGPGVLHDHIAAVRLGLLHLVRDGLLGGPLDVPVDGQLDVGTGDGRHLLGARGGHPAAAGLGVLDLAVLARELLVQLRFEAARALALRVDVAQYPGGQPAVGVDPFGGRLLEDAGQHIGSRSAVRPVLLGLLGEDGLEVLDLLPDLWGLATRQDRVPALRLRQLLRQLPGVDAEDGGEEGRGLLRCVRGLAVLGREHLGVGGDVVRVDADGQSDAAAVGDLAALGGDGVLEVAVLLGLRRVRAGVDGLDLEEPDDEREHDERQRQADQAEPGTRAAEAQRARRRPPRGAASRDLRRRAAGGGPGAARAGCGAAGARGAGDPAARRFLRGHCVTCRDWSRTGVPG